MTKRCLRCYAELSSAEKDHHRECALEIFGAEAPIGDLHERFTVESSHAELRDLTMRLASAAAIITVPHTLLRSEEGELIYAERRLDITPSGEDCDFDTIRLILDESEGEYRVNGSYEQIAEIVEGCSTISKLDVLNLWEQIAFSWVVGCTQMGHLSFAMYQPHKGLYALAPAFSMLADGVFSTEPHDELMLTINRKRRGITRGDFEVAMKRSGIKEKIIKGLFARFADSLDRWCEIIDSSFVDEGLKVRYKEFLRGRVLVI